jgi:hypothetical protein
MVDRSTGQKPFKVMYVHMRAPQNLRLKEGHDSSFYSIPSYRKESGLGVRSCGGRSCLMN